MRAVLCMGIDTKGDGITGSFLGKGGDADAIFSDRRGRVQRSGSDCTDSKKYNDGDRGI